MRTREIIREARDMGKQAGINAASWVEISEDNAAAILAGMNDCDPAVMDAFNTPNLSGEFAGDPTPASLLKDIGVDEDDARIEWIESDACAVWEDAASASFYSSIERRCAFYLKAA
jgi:hypothetical protein